MDYLSNFIVQSPFHFLGSILTLAGLFCISVIYWMFKKGKREHQIQYDIKQKKLAELKAHEEYKAQFKSIHQIREKFKAIKR